MTNPSTAWTRDERETLITTLADKIRTEIRATHPNLARLDAWAEAVMLLVEKTSLWLEANREYVLKLLGGEQ